MAFPGGAAAKRIVLETIGWVLVLSGCIALGLLAYSYWKYRVQGVAPPEPRQADDLSPD
jgi:hypothetical protein